MYICIHAGHGGFDPGACANNYTEAELTIDLRDRIAHYLINNTEGIGIKRDNDDHSLSEVVREYNAVADEKTVNLEIHFNAGPPAATGCETFIPTRHTEEESEFARKIAVMTASILNIRNRGVKTEEQSARKKLYISQMDGCNILLEVCFLTNKEDMSSYLLRREHLAEEIGKILVEAHERLKK